MQLNDILQSAIEKRVSDIHLKAGIFPVVRRSGTLRPLDKDLPKLTGAQIEQFAYSLMDEHQREQFLKNREIDLGYGVSGLGRFRINVFFQRGTIRMVIRNIPYEVPTLAQLNLPEKTLQKLADNERGLILVTGMTGSGKSSTVAAMIDYINQTQNKHILTLEDPIEFLIRDRKCLITQRELGVDTNSYHRALRAALRQDPDIIFIGEMRDKETIETALMAAETGHLVLSTLHTMDSRETINRVVSAFEPYQQQQVRYQLASVLKGIISQRLVLNRATKEYVPCLEILINNTRIKEMIELPERTRQILQVIEESKVSYGMQSFDQALMDLVQAKVISYEEAMSTATEANDFAVKYKGITRGHDESWKKKSDEDTDPGHDADLELEDRDGKKNS